MALRLQIVSRHRQSLGERGMKEFGQNGGTIGRSLESDWVLPDGQRFLSSRHASIDFRSGSYYIIDTSTNGVYVNGSDQPVGRGNPQRLFSGDRVRLGDYEILVEIDEIDETQEQLSDLPHVDPVDLKQRVEAPEPTGEDLVDPFEVTGVGIESLLDEHEAATLTPLDYKFKGEDLRLEEEVVAAPAPAPASKPHVKPKSAKARALAAASTPPRGGAKSNRNTRAASPAKVSARPASASPAKASARPTSAPAAAQAAAATAAPTAAAASRQRVGAPAPAAISRQRAAANGPTPLDSFFRGAGMQPRALEEGEAEEILHRIGQVMREMIVGLTENLNLRAAQKSALRQSNTTIQPRENNSLKFSAGVDEAFNNVLFRESEQYLDAVESVREAFGDVKTHQQVLMKALQTAIGDYIARLDPDQLEEKFAIRKGMLMGATNKLKYWDLYKDLYQVVAQQNAGELPDVFLEEMSRAYEAELERATGTKRGTQKLKVG